MAARALLETKYHIPPRRPNLIQRTRILARLDESLLPGCKLTLVSAPAGFGKTTLLSDWQAALASRGIPLAWLSLDEGDNEPARFLRYFVTALHRLLSNGCETTLALLDQPQLPSLEMLLTSLVNEITANGQESVLVLDDYHLIENVPVHQAVAFLLEHQPAVLHLVILTRQDPLLPLARLRARGQVCEIRSADLRFSEAEAGDFLQTVTGLRLTPDQMSALDTRIEGWIAGLQMVALAVRGNGPLDLDALLAGFTGSHHFVFDYLAEEVLAQQPPDLVDFLHQTAFLERLCPALCDAITGRSDGQQFLRRIEQANLFLSPLDEQHKWYRYHPLFADFIRSTESLQDETSLRGRAALWFERNNMNAEALAQYRALKDWQAVRRLILTLAMPMYMDGEIDALDQWISTLPLEILRQDGSLLAYQGMVMIMKNQLSDAAAAVEQAEQVWTEGLPSESHGCLYGVKAYLAHGAGQEEQALSLAQAALSLLNENQPGFSSMLLALVGQILLQAGRMDESERSLHEAIRLGAAKKNSVGMCIAQSNLGRVINVRGQRRRSDDYFRAVVSQCVDGRGRELPLTLFLYAPWAMTVYDANLTDTAWRYLEKEFAYCQQMGIHPIIVGGLTTMALIQRARGDLDGAYQTIHEAREAAIQFQIPWVARQTAALEAMFRLQAGDAQAANDWADTASVTLPASLAVDREFELGCLARTFNAEGRFCEALNVLAPLAAVTEREDCRRSLITLELIQAVSENGLGKKAEALRRVCRAIGFAAPEGYIRAFLDEGKVILPLLQAVVEHIPGEGQGFARELIHALRNDEQDSNGTQPVFRKLPDQSGLVEPLSPRELEVLSLMAEGLSKAEIAQKLYLTINTLKAHTNSIYGKLEVHNRMQAVNKARELKLI